MQRTYAAFKRLVSTVPWEALKNVAWSGDSIFGQKQCRQMGCA